MVLQYLKDGHCKGLPPLSEKLPMDGHEDFQFCHFGKWMMLLFDIGKMGILLVHLTHPLKKLDDWSGVQFTNGWG